MVNLRLTKKEFAFLAHVLNYYRTCATLPKEHGGFGDIAGLNPKSEEWDLAESIEGRIELECEDDDTWK